MLINYFSNPFHSKRDRKFTVTLLFLCVIYIIPVILADRYYIDDLGRGLWGYTSWSKNGRPLADLIMYFIGFGGENIVDISPLTQFFSVLLFVFSAYHYFKSNMGDTNPIYSAVVFFFAFANPFLLENLSYKFDSLPMIMALCLLMFAFIRVGSITQYWVLSFVVIFASLCLYQAAIGFFVCLAVVEFVQKYIKSIPYARNDIYKTALSRVIQLLSAYTVYAIFIAPKYVTGDYNLTHSKSIEITAYGWDVFLKNIDTFLSKILNHFGSLHYQLFTVCVFFCCWFFIVFFKRFRGIDKVSVSGDIVPSIIVFLSPFLVFLFSFLHLSLLASPVFADRVLISFSGVMFFIGWVFFSVAKRWRLTIIFPIPIILFFFVFSYSYGNALKAQKYFDDSLTGDVIANINRIDAESSKKISVYGIQPSSLVRSNTVKRYPLIGSLVPLYMRNDWYWGAALLHYHGMKNKWGGAVNTELLCTMMPLYKSANYTLLGNESTIVIAFIKPKCN